INTIDLLPETVAKEIKQKREKELVRKISSTSGVVCAGMLSFLLVTLAFCKLGLSVSERRLKKIKPKLQEALLLRSENERLAERQATFQRIADDRKDWSKVLYEVSRLIPRNVWLISMETEARLSSEREELTKSSKLRLKGIANSQNDLTEVLVAFEGSSFFSNVQLLYAEKIKTNPSSYYIPIGSLRFEIIADLKY
ncbi:MAG: PilN domain-containing protein, partial [Candidatus Edwardsbacteria bacterium]